MRAILAVLVMLILAGCLSGKNVEDRDGAAAALETAALPFLSQHHGDDSDPSLHDDASLHRAAMNLELVGYHNGVDASGDPDRIANGSYYTELAIHGHHAYLARGSVTPPAGPGGIAPQQGGFVILDISEPSKPEYVGEFDALTGSDIEVSDKGDLAFFATQRNTVEEIVGNVQEEGDGRPRGIHVVDVTNKREPREILFHPFPYNGPHTITYHHSGSREFLIVQTYDFYANTVPSSTGSAVGGLLGGTAGGVFPATQRVNVLEILRMPGDGLHVALAQVAHYQRTDAPQGGKLFFPHDAQVSVHPLRGKTYMYVAYWDLGVRIVDITDLPGPSSEAVPLLEETGSFTDFSHSSLDSIHLAKPFEALIGGRHITVAEPEVVRADESGYITFIDTTTPSRPEKPCPTSYWKVPGDLRVDELEFSPHNFDTFHGKVALAHNHAGLWIIDVHDEENLCDPKSVGFFMAVHSRQDSPRHQPYFWGVLEHDGLLYASDESSGLYVLRYTGP